ncbi:DUF4245 family protein [Marmoricola sp. RAF53]|uniref:DUF4245 family protein n=1 Tax=Marmoricola sp. RAF53 TaxID=3233059 RepID=UPI003F962DCD
MSMTEAEARRLRPWNSAIVALVVALVVAIGWYYLGRPDESTRPVKAIPAAELVGWVKAGRADGKLTTSVPDPVPAGWKVTSAKYETGVAPHWHVGMLTPGKYVGLEESRDTTENVVKQYVDENAVRGDDVEVGGNTWQTWTDAGGDYALVRTATAPDGEQQRVIVYGSAPNAEIRDLAASLSATAVPGA